MYAGVIVDVKSRNTDKIFTYKVPEKMNNINVGIRVAVPFRNRIVEGYVINITDNTNISDKKLKEIYKILDDFSIFDEKMLKLAWWIKEYYNCFFSESLQCIMPAGINQGCKEVKKVRLLINSIPENISDRAPRQLEILNYLLENNCIDLSDLLKNLNISYSSVKALEKKGCIEIFDEEINRYKASKFIKTESLKPTSEQKRAINMIKDSIDNNLFNKFLLFGVTGSGKTEVYLQLIERCIELGKSSIVLVPEISLTPQTIERFIGRFGNLVAVMHSRLSQGERFDEWRKIKKGEVKVVVGVRNAIFAPFSDLGLVIIDEEHEGTYKQSDLRPKYNVKEVAEKRCEIENAVLVLGSATPSIESYYKAIKSEYKLIKLSERIGIPLPEVDVINMSDELSSGNNSIFSRRLYNEIKLNLCRGEQTILFLNRRGFSSFVSCRNCGYVPKCPNCDISLTFHAYEKKLRCHYCGYSINMFEYCPKCKSNRIRHLGIGTERIENDVKKYFPESRILRMDVDTTKTKGSHERIFYDFKNGKADILIGTQMISKGFDIPNVTLVGVILADVTLNIPDFRSGEKTFQLLTQVAGRAGRGEKAGRVIIQTYEDNNYSIKAAKLQNYLMFYNEEIQYREIFKYPPFTHLMNIVIYGKEKQKVIENAAKIYNVVKNTINKFEIKSYNKVLGPSSAPLEKIKNNYRWQIIIKNEDRNNLLKIADVVGLIKYDDDIKIAMDIDPINML
jgi:primosomal protein N' (replication factor Y)